MKPFSEENFRRCFIAPEHLKEWCKPVSWESLYALRGAVLCNIIRKRNFCKLTGFLGKQLFVELQQASFVVTLVFLLIKLFFFINFLVWISMLPSPSTSLLALTQTSHETRRVPFPHNWSCVLIPDNVSVLRIGWCKVYFCIFGFVY